MFRVDSRADSGLVLLFILKYKPYVMLERILLILLLITIGSTLNLFVKGVLSSGPEGFNVRYAWLDNKRAILLSTVTNIVTVALAVYVPGAEKLVLTAMGLSQLPDQLALAGMVAYGFSSYAIWRNLLKKDNGFIIDESKNKL